MQVRVYYEDTDIGGVVYYANYLKYCERARSELFFCKGLSPICDGGHFVVKRIEADYIKSAKFGDVLDITTQILSKRGASITLKQEVLKDNILIFVLTVELVYLKDDKISKIPQNIIDIFAR